MNDGKVSTPREMTCIINLNSSAYKYKMTENYVQKLTTVNYIAFRVTYRKYRFDIAYCIIL